MDLFAVETNISALEEKLKDRPEISVETILTLKAQLTEK